MACRFTYLFLPIDNLFLEYIFVVPIGTYRVHSKSYNIQLVRWSMRPSQQYNFAVHFYRVGAANLKLYDR